MTARWVLPIAGPPIVDGHVTLLDGTIVDVGPGPGAARTVALGHVAVLPALVNAHTHLELSFLRGRVGAGTSFVAWVRQLMALRVGVDPAGADVRQAAHRALGEAVSSGTGLFGDVSNTLHTPLLSSKPLATGVVFHEVLGFRATDAPARMASAKARQLAVPASPTPIALAPHAPYSVSADLFRRIRRDVEGAAWPVTTVHLAESPEEVTLLAEGTGPWRQAIEDFGAWDPTWIPPGLSPATYLETLGFLGPQVLAAHAVQCQEADRRVLAATGTTVVACPRSNAHVGVGQPPLAELYASGVRVAFGTDSLASAPDMNLFSELAAARRAAPGESAARLLASATRVGAEALGYGATHGHLTPGARPGVIAVAVPDGVDDVEEYLVSGVRPEQVSWVCPPTVGVVPAR